LTAAAVISSGPSDPTQVTSATFVFFSSRPGSSFECQLDGGNWGSCSSPSSYSGLSSGDHTFSARAIDATGRVDPTPATAAWTIGSYVLSSGSLKLLSGTPAKHRTIPPGIDLKAGTATIGTAFCAADASHACMVSVQLTIPQAPSRGAATAALHRKARVLTLGTTRLTIKAGHHASVKVRLNHGARTALAKSSRIRAQVRFTLPSRRVVARTILLTVSHPKSRRRR
jgi:hypothetical protein